MYFSLIGLEICVKVKQDEESPDLVFCKNWW